MALFRKGTPCDDVHNIPPKPFEPSIVNYLRMVEYNDGAIVVLPLSFVWFQPFVKIRRGKHTGCYCAPLNRVARKGRKWTSLAATMLEWRYLVLCEELPSSISAIFTIFVNKNELSLLCSKSGTFQKFRLFQKLV